MGTTSWCVALPLGSWAQHRQRVQLGCPRIVLSTNRYGRVSPRNTHHTLTSSMAAQPWLAYPLRCRGYSIVVPINNTQSVRPWPVEHTSHARKFHVSVSVLGLVKSRPNHGVDSVSKCRMYPPLHMVHIRITVLTQTYSTLVALNRKYPGSLTFEN